MWPLLLSTGWAAIRRSAAVTSAFILVNSLAGLAGNVARVHALPSMLPWLIVAAAIGGLIGAELGTRRLSSRLMCTLLAVILVPAGVKLMVPD